MTQADMLAMFKDDSGNAVAYRGSMVYFKKYSDKLGCWIVKEYTSKAWREYRIKANSMAGRRRLFKRTLKVNGVK